MLADVIRIERARADTAACDFSLVAGSWLVVYPAADFPPMAGHAGAKLAIVNRTPTDQDVYADLAIRDAIGATLSEALAEL